MMKLRTGFAAACIAISVSLVSCHSSEQLLSPSLSHNASKDPQFIDNISLAGNTNDIKMTVVDRRKDLPKNISANSLQIKYASILNVIPQAITNMPLYAFIDDWYGVRYRLGGSDKSGIDCSAFVQRLYENVFGTNVVRTAFEQFNMCKFLLKSDSLKEGDLVFFRTRGKQISHVGIYLMNNFFVHASASSGVMISRMDEAYWERRYAGAGQMPKEDRM